MIAWLLAFALAVCGLRSPTTITHAAGGAHARLLRSTAAAGTEHAGELIHHPAELLLHGHSLQVAPGAEGQGTTTRGLLQGGMHRHRGPLGLDLELAVS